MGLFDYLEEKRNEAIRRRRCREASKVFTSMAFGALVGVLYAPQEGKKTREEIAQRAEEAANQAINVANDAKDTIEFKAYQAGEQAKQTYGELRDKAATKKREFDEDVEVAKAKAGAIGEIVRSGAEDVKKNVKNTTDEVKDTAEDVKGDLKEGAHDVKKEAKKSSEDVKETVKDTKNKVEREADRR